MHLIGFFGKAKPRRVVVREYGRDSFLGLLNPLMTFLILGARNATARTNYRARLIEKMEDDSVEVRRLGYRVVSSREYERPALGITYFKVTYELVQPPKYGRASAPAR
ncbi:MAG: hypothetical protein ACXWN4_01875 [Candidatus Limnocylindrales bacterium]